MNRCSIFKDKKIEMKIEIRDNIDDSTAIALVGIVIDQGRISKGIDSKGESKMCYCWATEITYQDKIYMVYVRNNRKSDCFVVTKKK